MKSWIQLTIGNKECDSFLLDFPTRQRLIFKLWKKNVHNSLHMDTKIWLCWLHFNQFLSKYPVDSWITDCKNIDFPFLLTFLSNIYCSYFTRVLIKVSVNSSLYFWLITETSISQTWEAWWVELQLKHQDSHTLHLLFYFWNRNGNKMKEWNKWK